MSKVSVTFPSTKEECENHLTWLGSIKIIQGALSLDEEDLSSSAPTITVCLVFVKSFKIYKNSHVNFSAFYLTWFHNYKYIKKNDLWEHILICVHLCVPMDCSPPVSSAHGIVQEKYWSGLPFPSPGDLPNPGIKSRSLTLQAYSLLSELPGKPL